MICWKSNCPSLSAEHALRVGIFGGGIHNRRELPEDSLLHLSPNYVDKTYYLRNFAGRIV